MTTVLITAALASLLLAVSMIAIARRYVRESRARVHALEALAFEGQAPQPEFTAPEPQGPVPDLPLRTARRPAAELLFAAVDEPPPPARRWISLAAVGSVMLGVISVVFVLNDPVAAPAPAETTRPSVATQRPGGPAPLVLLALRHEVTRDGALTITGRVKDGDAGQLPGSVLTVITAFDADGRRVATRETAVDARAAADGAASFAATFPDARGVARYDVRFTRPDGTTVEHVDRRSEF